MIKQGFIQFDEKNSRVELTLRFDVTETENSHHFISKNFPGPEFLRIVKNSLKQRMKHCQDILTNDILPQSDKVFTSEFIYSNKVGEHFSLVAYKAMEDALGSLYSYGQTGELFKCYLKSLTPMQLLQLLKAIATMDRTDISDQRYREAIDIVSEALVMAKWNEEIKNKQSGGISPLFFILIFKPKPKLYKLLQRTYGNNAFIRL